MEKIARVDQVSRCLGGSSLKVVGKDISGATNSYLLESMEADS